MRVLEPHCEWTAADMRDAAVWTEVLTKPEQDEIDAALRTARAKSDDLLEIGAADFPLPRVGARIARINPIINDLLLTPTISVAAFPVERLNPEHYPQHRWDWFPWASFSYPFNFTQQPAATVPAGLTPSGLPVGLQIVGRRFADLTVLQASAAFEAARPWHGLRPVI